MAAFPDITGDLKAAMPKLRGRLLARCQDPERVRAARHRLIEAGCAEGLVQRFLPLQVILLDEKRDYEVERDERLKLLALPLWQVQSLAGIEDGNPGRDGLFADLLPHVVTLRRTQGELQRQIAAGQDMVVLTATSTSLARSFARSLSRPAAE